GALDFGDEVSGPYDSVNGKALYGGTLVDKDCSEDEIECSTCSLSGLPALGKITEGDTFGIFDGSFGEILNDGVWSFATSYGNGLIGKEGGEIPLCLWPREENNDMSVRVFTTHALYDYNSMISHPPYFIKGGGDGIDYCGIALLGWKSSNPPPPPDPDPPNPDPPGDNGRNDGIYFSEFVVVDHSLQYSDFSYSSSIRPDYDPTLQHMIRDFRSYPGGQTHSGRSGQTLREGRNACPANWENQFVKLGTEFFPMSDYGIFFVLRDSSDGGLLSFEAKDRSHKITSIEVSGPFITPHFPLSNVRYGGLSDIPLTYDWDGEISIDSRNYKEYELSGSDWTKITNPGMRESVRYSQANSVLEYSRRLNYSGIPKVIVIDELIPVQYGKINIRVHLADGRVGDYYDCCDVPMIGIPVHALDIGDYTGGIEYEKDCEFTTTIKEHENMQNVKQVNDAVVFIWQDRGVKSRYNQEILEGAGDGWVTMAPESSENSGYSTAYSSMDDLNDDGKISFNDYETEIIGSYSLASNTWAGGMIDARTFQRNNGKYAFTLSEENRCIIDTVGMDFNKNGVIDDSEILPVYITAYKYGDDNNSRGYGPIYTNPLDHRGYSHAVYLSGQNIAPVGYSSGPQKSFNVEITPKVLTAGVSSESVFQGQPLTIKVTKENGSPVDLTNNGALSTEEVAALFNDDTPFNLPDYYWVRTNLQNNTKDAANNNSLFGQRIIQYDFSNAKNGVYVFKNFVANDSGSFRLRVVDKSRRNYGVTEVKIELPSVSYKVTPSAPDGLIPGELYSVKAIMKDASGKIMKGRNIHFLPYSFSSADKYLPVQGGEDSENLMQWFSYDKEYNMQIDLYKRERNKSGWFGSGAIYNDPYNGTVYFADKNKDDLLNHSDSITDVNGEVEFLIPACGEATYGGFVGCNTLLSKMSISDVAGGQPSDHGGSLARRYKPDGQFYIDWFANSIGGITARPLKISIYDENKNPISTVNHNIKNPDLISGTDNKIFLKVKKAGKALIGFQFYSGSKKLNYLEIESVDEMIPITVRPTTSGEGVIDLVAVYQFDGMAIPFEQVCMSFDVTSGVSVEVIEGKILYTGQNAKVVLKINQAYNDSLKDTMLGLKGYGIEEWEPIEKDGTALFYFTPQKAGQITIHIKGPQILTNSPAISVLDSDTPPYINIDEYPSVTKKSSIIIQGETQIGCSVFVDIDEISVAENGKFTIELNLEEGKNEFKFMAFNPKGVKAEELVVVWKRTVGPEIVVDPLPEGLNSETEIDVTGTVTPPDSIVSVNDKDAFVNKNGQFTCKIQVDIGENIIHVKAVDSIGNASEKKLTLTVKNQIVIVLTIGKKLMMIDGKSNEMDVAPFIRNGRTMVPIRAIAEAFGAIVNWKAATETVEIQVDDLFISMQIGNPVAMVGKKVTSLDSPPIIENGRTFVPLRFIAESFGAEVEWVAETRTIIIYYNK
ncbi:MAG: copper amine oxidase N-terminal domain-containing protein, partial [Caldisericia bacterium]|nr:copper amine oxidase N-terminal domain-containing protein [Caldisericia bacterium]